MPKLILLLVLSLTSQLVEAQQDAIFSSRDRFHPVFAEQGMVASQEALATRIGVDILKRGGNAVDAAVAVGFALAVTLPRAGNLGGGGFMLVHQAKENRSYAIDYRETAPASATADLYLDANGKVDKKRKRFSHQSAGVPGTVAGLILALENFGSMSLKDVIAPAIRLAGDGILVTEDLADSIRSRQKRLRRNAPAAKVFFHGNGSPYRSGEHLVQTDLANSLKMISEYGASAFYSGSIAQRIVKQMAANKGLITLQDLKDYRAKIRKPVSGTYRGHHIVSMPPPSSGGVHLIQMLNILESYPIGFLGHNSADSIHLMVEAMRLAYADRSQHLGDPDFWPVPVAGLVSKDYAESLRKGINMDQAKPSMDVAPGKPHPYESNETTHFSVMDNQGNMVSNTYTLNFSFGSGVMVEGTGILLNNEMDDFSAKVGAANAYGLIGGKANSVAPHKRPLSSMTPTLVFKDGQPLLATGSPGGSRIITTVMQVILNVIDHKKNIAEAVSAPRIHHQWLPDEIRTEDGISFDTRNLLRKRGHSLRTKSAMGSANSIMRIEQGFLGAADPRRRGALALGY